MEYEPAVAQPPSLLGPYLIALVALALGIVATVLGSYATFWVNHPPAAPPPPSPSPPPPPFAFNVTNYSATLSGASTDDVNITVFAFGPARIVQISGLITLSTPDVPLMLVSGSIRSVDVPYYDTTQSEYLLQFCSLGEPEFPFNVPIMGFFFIDGSVFMATSQNNNSTLAGSAFNGFTVSNFITIIEPELLIGPQPLTLQCLLTWMTPSEFQVATAEARSAMSFYARLLQQRAYGRTPSASP